jgi:hypothetical protein
LGNTVWWQHYVVKWNGKKLNNFSFLVCTYSLTQPEHLKICYLLNQSKWVKLNFYCLQKTCSSWIFFFNFGIVSQISCLNCRKPSNAPDDYMRELKFALRSENPSIATVDHSQVSNSLWIYISAEEKFPDN